MLYFLFGGNIPLEFFFFYWPNIGNIFVDTKIFISVPFYHQFYRKLSYFKIICELQTFSESYLLISIFIIPKRHLSVFGTGYITKLLCRDGRAIDT